MARCLRSRDAMRTDAEMSSEPPSGRRRVTIRQGGELLTGRLPGNIRFRLPRRPNTSQILIPEVRRYHSRLHPTLILIYGFVALIDVGTLLLSLPISSASRQWTRPLVALFT